MAPDAWIEGGFGLSGNHLVSCGRAPGLGLAVALAFVVGVGACGQGSDGASSISAAGLAQRIEAGTAPLILDVRTPEEYSAGHIPGSLNIPHDQLSGRLAELAVPVSAEIVVHCRSGRRAEIAESVLSQAGYSRIRDLDGHMLGWHEAGLPTE